MDGTSGASPEGRWETWDGVTASLERGLYERRRPSERGNGTEIFCIVRKSPGLHPAVSQTGENALEDLLKLQWELRQDGVEAALEKSRRGAHLWIFADKPLLARHCRIYIYNLALRLKVPVKGGSGLAEGIEVFPRQDQLGPDEFGNAIRGPLGVHRATGRRYWFYGADYRLDAQLEYLERLRKITESEIGRFINGLEMPEEFRPRPQVELPPCDPTRPQFRILDHVRPTSKRGGNYWARCPSCADHGRDRSGDNLA